MPKKKNLVSVLIGLAITISVVSFLNYEAWVTFPKARAPIRALMKDPDGTIFRGEFISYMGWFCGEVNSKNEYGAYVGYKRFFSNARPVRIFIEGVGRADEGASEESTEDYIALLSKENKILDQENLARESGKPHTKYTSTEIRALANQQIFEEQWAERCQLHRMM